MFSKNDFDYVGILVAHAKKEAANGTTRSKVNIQYPLERLKSEKVLDEKKLETAREFTRTGLNNRYTSWGSPFQPAIPVPATFDIRFEEAMGLGLLCRSLSRSPKPWLASSPKPVRFLKD